MITDTKYPGDRLLLTGRGCRNTAVRFETGAFT